MAEPAPARHDDDRRRAIEAWIASLPKVARALAERFPPTRMYWLDPPGQTVSIYAYHDNGTLTVIVDPAHNPAVFVARRVFGIPPEDLHELDDARRQ